MRQASPQLFILKGTVSYVPSMLPARNGTWQRAPAVTKHKIPGP